jgi:divalent metal cation (Fe/Co/Zn/Cd) transporter
MGPLAASGADFSTPGLILTVAAIPIMYVLSRHKLALAEQLGSRALRADAIESITCGWLSFVVVIGLVAQLTLGAWWVDSVGFACHRLFPDQRGTRGVERGGVLR